MVSADPHCTNCGDQFSPIEGNRPSDEPGDQSNFCSDDCYNAWHDAVDAESAYREAGWPAPMW